MSRFPIRAARRHKRHDLSDLLTVAVCAVLSGVDDFVDIELWAEAKIEWLRGFMKLEHGIPTRKASIKSKRMLAASTNQFRAELLGL